VVDIATAADDGNNVGLTALLNRLHKSLGGLNIEIIGWLCSTMGIKTEMIRSSSFIP